ncbi:MAG TPA: uroporphyrinogen decarboxylase family protein [Aggregatilineales bacterium]|nr:uroporphyrinogen decarboxylase family protein [Aggregatilineales bacterium]
MNGRERIALAMQHQTPDRVPVMCQLAIGHYFLNTDIKPRDIWFTSEGFAEALVTLQRRYRFDGILINLPGRPENLLDDVTSIEATEEGEWLTWSNGERTIVPWDDNAHHYLADGSDLPRFDFMSMGVEDLDHIDDFSGYLWNIYHIPWLPGKTDRGPLSEVPGYFFRTIDLVKEKTGGEVSVHGEVFSPFTHFMELIGYENALMSLMIDPEKAHALLDRLTGAAVAWAVAQAERGVDAVLISSAFAGGPLLSPGMYREFVVPYERRVTDAVKAAGVPVYTHTCGSIGDRLELMVETGTEGIDTLDPPPLGNTELADAKQRIGEQVFIKGNMNSVELLQFTDAAQVVEHATDRIQKGMPGSGYILSSACSVSPKVEPWKLELLTPLAEKLGKYE